jgi:benzoyl-CoA reductase/2-hydroxyglutaryl-CoA dehydratase subunit BcrC/BadD/HgdB
VEKYGGQVVLDASTTGERTEPGLFDRRRLQDDPLMELCQAYFGSIPDAFRRPNSELYKWLKHHIADRKVRGIIFLRYLWCDTWHAEVKRLKEWTPLPVLDLEHGDEERSNRQRTTLRIQAFLETFN